jgi:hypothetical protein
MSVRVAGVHYRKATTYYIATLTRKIAFDTNSLPKSDEHNTKCAQVTLSIFTMTDVENGANDEMSGT